MSAYHRVDKNTLMLPKELGGVKLILFREQARCLTAKLVIGAISEGNHPLQLILCFRIQEISQ